MDLNNFFEKSLFETKLFCDSILHTNNYYERELLLYKLCPFQSIPYNELIKILKLFEIKTIYEFIIILIHGLYYSDEELIGIEEIMHKYNFSEHVDIFLKKGLHTQKRLDIILEKNDDIGVNAEIIAYNYEKEKFI